MAVNFTTLTGDKSVEGSIKSWINVTTTPSTLILTMAEQWCWRRLRVRQMLHRDGTLVCTMGERFVDLPSDYIEGRLLLITGTEAGKIRKANAEKVEGLLSYDDGGDLTTGKPGYWYADATQLAFDVAALETYPLSLLYYRQLPPLAEENETNFLTDRATRLLFASCLAFANEFQKDDTERDRWLAIAEAEVARLNAESEGEEIRSAEIDPRAV